MKVQLTIKSGAIRKRAVRLAGLAGLLAVAVSLPAAAQSLYKLTDLGTHESPDPLLEPSAAYALDLVLISL